MGELTFNPVVQSGVNRSADKTAFTAEAGFAVTDHVEKGGFEGFFSLLPSFSYTGGEKRISASGTLTGMVIWPILTTIGPRVSYNIDEKSVEVGAMGCVQSLIPVGGNVAFFGGLCFTANDLANVKNDGVSGLLTFTGQL